MTSLEAQIKQELDQHTADMRLAVQRERELRQRQAALAQYSTMELHKVMEALAEAVDCARREVVWCPDEETRRLVGAGW